VQRLADGALAGAHALGDVEFDQFFAGGNAATDDIGAKLFVDLVGQ
jgi:hypothetical protein